MAQRSNDETFHLTQYSIVSKQTKKLAQGHAARVAFVEEIKFVSTLNKSYFQRIIQVFLYPEVLKRFVDNPYCVEALHKGKLQNLDVGRLDDFGEKPGQFSQK